MTLERAARHIKVTCPPCWFQLLPLENVNRSTTLVYSLQYVSDVISLIIHERNYTLLLMPCFLAYLNPLPDKLFFCGGTFSSVGFSAPKLHTSALTAILYMFVTFVTIACCYGGPVPWQISMEWTHTLDPPSVMLRFLITSRGMIIWELSWSRATNSSPSSSLPLCTCRRRSEEHIVNVTSHVVS